MLRVLTAAPLVLLSLVSISCEKEKLEETSGYVKMVNSSGNRILYPGLNWDNGFAIFSNGQKSNGVNPGPMGLTENQRTFANRSTSLFYVQGVGGAVADFSFAYYDRAKKLKSAEYKSAFAIGESKRAVITVQPDGAANFGYEAMPSGGSGSGDGGNDCSGYSSWQRQCAAGGMAACYCATAVLDACYGHSSECRTNVGYASSLGTNCGVSCN